MVLKIQKAKEENLNRIFEMIQRTNQLNTTTIRHPIERIKEFLLSDNYNTYIADLIDKYGEYGTIGLAIIYKEQKIWIFDTFLFSCRAMGKTVENTMLLWIINEARNEGIEHLIGRYKKTEKNAQMEKFFGEAGFQSIENLNQPISNPDYKTENFNIWLFNPLSDFIKEIPDWIELIE